MKKLYSTYSLLLSLLVVLLVIFFSSSVFSGSATKVIDVNGKSTNQINNSQNPDVSKTYLPSYIYDDSEYYGVHRGYQPEVEETKETEDITTPTGLPIPKMEFSSSISLSPEIIDSSNETDIENPNVKLPPNISTERLLNSLILTPIKTENFAIDEKVAEIIGTGDTFEKVKRCYDWLIDNVKYASSYPAIPGGYPNNSIFSNWYFKNACGPLFTGKGRCNNYSAAMTIMLRAIGIESYNVYGRTRAAAGGYIGHYWTVAFIDGVEYIFDAQIEDDLARRRGGLVDYTYFCKARSNMTERYKWDDAHNISLVAQFGINSDYYNYLNNKPITSSPTFFDSTPAASTPSNTPTPTQKATTDVTQKPNDTVVSTPTIPATTTAPALTDNIDNKTSDILLTTEQTPPSE